MYDRTRAQLGDTESFPPAREPVNSAMGKPSHLKSCVIAQRRTIPLSSRNRYHQFHCRSCSPVAPPVSAMLNRQDESAWT
jgi:hypothetical protein